MLVVVATLWGVIEPTSAGYDAFSCFPSAVGVLTDVAVFDSKLPLPCNPAGALKPGDGVRAGLWMNDTVFAPIDGKPYSSCVVVDLGSVKSNLSECLFSASFVEEACDDG